MEHRDRCLRTTVESAITIIWEMEKATAGGQCGCQELENTKPSVGKGSSSSPCSSLSPHYLKPAERQRDTSAAAKLTSGTVWQL